MSFRDIYLSMHKQSAAMLTPQAMQAAVQPPPPQGAPMDPSMGGAPMPPQGAPPMDPSMGMPPGGDPAMMGGAGAPPMDPSMGMPPQGAPAGGPGMPPPGAWMQDQMFIQFLASMGVQVGPDGSVMDPQGNPVDPAMVDQIYMEFLAQMSGGGMPPQGAPAGDPGMSPGGDPSMGAPMPPEGGMPPQGAPAQLPPEIMDQMAGVIQDVIDSSLDAKLATLEKKIVAFAQKLDTVKSLLDDIALGTANADSRDKAERKAIDDELEQELKRAQTPQVQQPVPTQMAAPSNYDMLSLMRG